MQIKTLMVGDLASNCYLIETGENRCVAIDIGGSPEKVLSCLTEMNWKLEAILLTHGHWDHIAGVPIVQEKTNAAVYIHESDAPMLTDAVKSLANWIAPGAFSPIQHYQIIQGEPTLSFGDVCFSVLHTPGHTPGSVCYQTKNALFTGDTLFHLSRGRTDFPGGSDLQMRNSLYRLAHLTGNDAVYPGHNETSTLEEERAKNPNLQVML